MTTIARITTRCRISFMRIVSRIEVSSPSAAEAVSRNCSRCSQGLAQVTISCYFLSGDDNCSVHPRVVATHVLVCVRHCERVLVGGNPVHVSRVKATSPRRPDGRSDCVRRSSRQNLGHLSVVILTTGHSTHALEISLRSFVHTVSHDWSTSARFHAQGATHNSTKTCYPRA